MFAVLFMAVFISSLTSRMMELQRYIQKQTSKTRLWLSYMDMHGTKLSWSLIIFVSQHLKQLQSNAVDLEDEQNLLDSLPRYLQIDLLFAVRSPTLVVHP